MRWRLARSRTRVVLLVALVTFASARTSHPALAQSDSASARAARDSAASQVAAGARGRVTAKLRQRAMADLLRIQKSVTIASQSPWAK